MTGLVKICGLMRPEQTEAAALAGVDLIGLNFAESRRRVEPAVAKELVATARAVNARVRTVGLFVDSPFDEIRRVRDIVGFDLVQLHGAPPLDDVVRLGIPALIAVRAKPGDDRDALRAYVVAAASGPAELMMIDGYHPTLVGGSGVRADWTLAGELARLAPLLLAGGLNPGNVRDAIAAVRPAGVDVSSGVERDGVKDAGLIREFIANARAAFDEVSRQTSTGTLSHDSP